VTLLRFIDLALRLPSHSKLRQPQPSPPREADRKQLLMNRRLICIVWSLIASLSVVSCDVGRPTSPLENLNRVFRQIEPAVVIFPTGSKLS